MSNLRTQARHLLNVYLKVLDAETGEPLGRIVDLTTHGMRVVINGPVELGQEMQLLITTDIGDGSADSVRIDARCTWLGRDVNPDHEAAGFEFEHIRPRQEIMLARVIQQFTFNETC